MKKLFLTTVCFFAMIGALSASPFLVCDCQDNVEQYVVNMDGAIAIVDASDGAGTSMVCTNGQKRLSYDVGSISDGNHHVEVKAKNKWGESVAVPFDFSKTLPGEITGIGLSAD